MAGGLEVTFLGNEGVLVTVAGTAVLVDALCGDGVPAFTTTPRAVVDAVEMARTPFDLVEAALATHFHPDHFNPYSVARHLQHNAAARFVSTRQSIALLEEKAADFAAISGRVHPVAPAEGERESVTVGANRVDAFGLSHGKVNYGDVEHVGFVVYLGGATLLHLGDGIIAEKTLRSAGVLDETIDAAFLPFWYLTYPAGRRVLEGGFSRRLRRIFAVHIPPAHEARLVEEVRRFDPHATALVTPMSRFLIPES
jgi:L-ascorbate metabolism protein UlaG (beta-lactamase superfamily)